MAVAESTHPDVDFEALMMDLRRHGFTQAAVAGLTGLPLSTVKSYAYGQRPNFDYGERLVSVWCSITHGTRTQLPRRTLAG